MQGIKGYQTGTPGYEIIRLKTKLIQLGNRTYTTTTARKNTEKGAGSLCADFCITLWILRPGAYRNQ